MNRSQFLRILLLTLTTAGTLHAAEKKPKATIGVSLLTLTHPFFRDLGDAIVLAPCDSKAVGTVIAEANKAGIPVFTVDIAALATGAKVVSHVATDNLSGGNLAAQAMIEALGGKGKVAIIDHAAKDASLK